jgi:hypothetical protein
MRYAGQTSGGAAGSAARTAMMAAVTAHGAMTAAAMTTAHLQRLGVGGDCGRGFRRDRVDQAVDGRSGLGRARGDDEGGCGNAAADRGEEGATVEHGFSSVLS